jgi:hypothetical protein
MALTEAEELELLELEESESRAKQSRGPDRSFEVPTPANITRSRQEQAQARQAQPDRGPIPGARALTGERIERMLGPTGEALAVGGGTILGGLAGGPAGAVGGAGLTYGMTQEARRRMRGEPVDLPQLSQDIALGGGLELAGRRFIAPILEKTGTAASTVLGKLGDLPQLGRTRAGVIAREAVGQDLPAVREALRRAIGEDVSTAQALARIDPATGKPALTLPTAQALLRTMAQKDPGFFEKMLGRQDALRIKELVRLSGGRNQTAARQAREEMKELTNKKLIPILRTELEAANIAGTTGTRLAGEVDKFGGAAERAVEDVRRFAAAGERAGAAQVFPVPGQPRVPVRYTYMGELAQRADEVANQAAAGSLMFGEARRFAQAALDSISAHGLQPLRSEPIVNAISRKLSDPSLAGNRDVQNALGRVAQDIQQWTRNGGVIDAWALDSIRKNSINSYINSMPMEPKAAKALASKVTESVRPILIDAVEAAGGTGYRGYLTAYSNAMDKIAQNKLGAEALKLYQSAPEDFIRLVESNNPKLVEKIFGPGNYNIAKQMSDDAMSRLTGIADEIKREKAIKQQAEAGTKALEDLFKEHMVMFSLPNWLNATVTTTNRLLNFIGIKFGKETMDVLIEAAKNAKSFDELLNVLPSKQKSEILQMMRSPSFFRTGTAAAFAGATSEPIGIDQLGGITNMNQGGF